MNTPYHDDGTVQVAVSGTETIVYKTRGGSSYCHECHITTTHIDLLDGWIQIEDDVIITEIDHTDDIIFCDGCGEEITGEVAPESIKE